MTSGKGAALDQDVVKIQFEGKTLTCRRNTSVAVALWENGIRTLSHSPKYGHPRGLTCARGQCTACLMRVDGEPNVRTCERTVQDGMDIRRQDSGAFYGPLLQKTVAVGSRFFPVGFYYKWFTRPPFVSRTFLKGIRPLTGVGRISLTPPPSVADPEDLGDFDTVVVGAGPSGLKACRNAAGSVLLIDENSLSGGPRGAALQQVANAGDITRFPVLHTAWKRLQTAAADVAELPNLTRCHGHRVIAGYQPSNLLIRTDDQLKTLGFRNLVWAAGAMDSLGLFPGNDTPGLIGPRALYRTLLRDGLIVRGAQVLVVGSGLDCWLCAALLASCGAHPSLVLTDTAKGDEIAAAVDFKWPLHTGLALRQVTPSGENRLVASFVPSGGQHGPHNSHLDMEMDLAVICKRGKPIFDIPQQLGREMALYPERGGFLPTGAGVSPLRGELREGVVLEVCGEAAGDLPGQDNPTLSEASSQ